MSRNESTDNRRFAKKKNPSLNLISKKEREQSLSRFSFKKVFDSWILRCRWYINKIAHTFLNHEKHHKSFFFIWKRIILTYLNNHTHKWAAFLPDTLDIEFLLTITTNCAFRNRKAVSTKQQSLQHCKFIELQHDALTLQIGR